MAKTKRKQLSDKLAAARSRSSATTTSLFEQKFTKQKYNILGRSNSNNGIRCGKPNASKAKAFEKREKTLGHESITVGKANRFVDRRIAEKWQGATKEDKMAKRFALVRRKRYAKEAFNLDENEHLTHYGQNLAQIEKFGKETVDLSDDDNDDYSDERGILSAASNFGGGESGESATKSRKDIIDEMIAKSKLDKQVKQHMREEMRNLTDLLDDQWKLALESNLFGSLNAKKEETPENVEDRPSAKNDDLDGSLATGQKKSSDYDKLVKELVFDRRSGAAQDRLKSDEEIRRDEREKFEKLQQEKLERMNHSTDYISAVESKRPKTVEHFNPDELEYNCSVGRGVKGDGKILTYSDGVRVDYSDEEEIDEDTAKVEDSSQFGEILFSPGKIADKTDSACLLVSYGQLKNSLSNLNDTQLSQHLDDLIKSLNPSLKPGNKQKLQQLFLYLLRFFDESCQRNPINFKILDRLTLYLFKLKEYGKEYAGKSVKALLKKHRSVYLAGSKKFKKPAPSANIICFLRLVPHLFPVTDFYHPIVTPCFLFLSEILRRLRLKDLRDFAVGLIICSIFLEFVKESKKFSPDIVNFLKNILETIFSGQKKRSPFALNWQTESFSRISLSTVFNDDSGSSVNCASCAICALKLCGRLCELYADLPSWLEIFEPIWKIVSNNNGTTYGPDLISELERFGDTFTNLRTKFSRCYLAYGPKQKKEFELLEPRVEKNFDPEKKRFKFDKGPKAQHEKLRKRYKREYKGTVRELRRDNEFLARRQLEQSLMKDRERCEKTKKLMASLMGQEADYKKMKRSKD